MEDDITLLIAEMHLGTQSMGRMALLWEPRARSPEVPSGSSVGSEGR